MPKRAQAITLNVPSAEDGWIAQKRLVTNGWRKFPMAQISE